MIVTIDGPSGTGKSTVAKGVAKRLNFAFFDTGAMYRAFAWLVLREGVDSSDQTKVEALLPAFQFEIRDPKGCERRYFVQGRDVSREIRSQMISHISSQIAVYPAVRQVMVGIQRKFGADTDAVFEGRDMGTVVFTHAEVKIFLTATAAVRAARRYRELQHKFPDLSMNQADILKDIEERDKTDSMRKESPLRQAEDAILIDTSSLSVEEVIEKIIQLMPQQSFPKMRTIYRLVYLLARLYFRCFFRLRIYGLNHFRPGAAVIAANHCSFLDPPVLSISCPEEVHFLAKKSLFDVPFLGFLIRILNSHPVKRGAADSQLVHGILDLLAQDKKVILFPEGARSKNGELGPFERGLSFLVQKARCRVQPAYIHGTFDAWPRTQKMPKFKGRIAVVFGAPIEWEEETDQPGQIVLRTEAAIRALKAWFLAGARGSPP